MKIGRFIVNILKRNSYKSTLKRRKIYPPHGVFKERINVPYIDDGNLQHSFDIYYANKENKKNCLIFDIHGGAYIFGEHQDNYSFAYVFVEQGYDVVTVDYEPNDGTLDTKDLVDDVVKCINYVLNHKEELDIDYDCVALTGDSAGGHFALLLSELLLDKDYAKYLGYQFPKTNLVACLVNCPVYNFAHIGDGSLSRSGMKRMFGPNYKDLKSLEDLCPKVHLESLTCPVFTSTCKQEFLRAQSFMLQDDMKKKGNVFELVDINSDEKGIGHVHNVLHPEHPLGKKVNDAMMNFLEKVRK